MNAGTNQIESIKAKLIKLSKANNESAMSAIEQIKERLFPDDKLQERTANFLSFCPEGNYSQRIEELYSCLNPFDNDFIVLREF